MPRMQKALRRDLSRLREIEDSITSALRTDDSDPRIIQQKSNFVNRLAEIFKRSQEEIQLSEEQLAQHIIEAAITKEWQTLCEQRGTVMVADLKLNVN